MCNGLEKRPDAALELLTKTSYPPVMPELDLSANTTKISLSDLSTLGVAFQPLTAAIQTVVSGGGGSGLYYVTENCCWYCWRRAGSDDCASL